MIKILAISGSLRRNSSNTTLLRAAAMIAHHDVIISLYEGLGNLPLFNPDLEGSEPASVLEFRHQLRKVDGVLIASPEYAHGITGALKNGLDWIVGSGEFVSKPVALLNASFRATIAQDSLKEIIKTMDAHIIQEASKIIPLPHNRLNQTDIIADPELSSLLKETIAKFSQAIRQAQGHHPPTFPL